MKTLAIETSARQTSVALLDQRGIVAERIPESQSFQPGSGSSSRLIPDINSLFDDCRWSMGDVQLISVTAGPGSFTGLRIGVVTAKTLAYALKTQIVAVNTLAVIAFQVLDCHSKTPLFDSGKTKLSTVVNAHRSQVFAKEFDLTNLKAVSFIEPETAIIDRDQWVAGLTDQHVVAGPGLKPIVQQISDQGRATVVSDTIWNPQARAVGQLGLRFAEQNRLDDLWSIEPFYFRPSYAEE